MIAIRPFEEKDAQALADLMMEMVRFYGATISPDLSVPDDIIRQSRDIDIIVATRGDRLLGFATFTTLYPVAGLISFTYVQQVYVGSAARRLGVAQGLIAAIAQTATARGSTQVEWSTARENTAARALYEGLGATGSDTVKYVLGGDALRQLASRSPRAASRH
jgi:ribosomal protein S18 acetylase RimI-like enzyme